MFCTNCGSNIEPQTKFCGKCGSHLPPSKTPVDDDSRIEPASPITNKRTKRIGGWLILLLIFLLIRLVVCLNLVQTDTSYLSNGTAEKANILIPGYSFLLKFEIIAAIAFLIAICCLIYLFIRKGSNFPKFLKYYLITDLCFGGIEYFLLLSLSPQSSEAQQILAEATSSQVPTLVGGLIAAGVWISYLNKSTRVKDTFTAIS